MPPLCVRFSRFNKFKSKNVNTVSADIKEQEWFERQPKLDCPDKNSTQRRVV